MGLQFNQGEVLLIFKVFRRALMLLNKRKFKLCGNKVIFDPLSSNLSYKSICLGNNVFIAPQAWFRSDCGGIYIGDNVMFGPKVQIYGGNHIFNIIGNNLNENHKGASHKDEDVHIKSDVWIGGSAIILTGITIGRGAIIGAGSVVTKNIPAYSVAAGNPCKVIKSRFTEGEIIKHEIALKNKEKF